MISAWSYVLVECFLYLKFLSISVTWKSSSLSLLCCYVRSMICKLCESKIKEKAKRRNYSRNVNCLFLNCKDRFCVWIMKRTFFICFLFLQSTDSIWWKRKKEIIKLKRMSICFQKEQNSKENLVLNKISGSIYYVCFFSIYPVFKEIHHWWFTIYIYIFLNNLHIFFIIINIWFFILKIKFHYRIDHFYLFQFIYFLKNLEVS